MPTPVFDRIAIEFLRKVNIQFKSAFTPGTAMPDAYGLTASVISDYINRALLKLFNDNWVAAAGDKEKFISLFPELVRISSAVTGDHTIATPHLDYYKVIGAWVDSDKKFIRVWNESDYALAISEKYRQSTATLKNPAIIEQNKQFSIFPRSLATTQIRIQYIKLPLIPTTGGYLIQNGSVDSPYFDHWNTTISELAYQLYLTEAYETT